MTQPIATVKFKDHEFNFRVGPSTEIICHEVFSDNYTIFDKGLQFGPGDIILDLGANEGMFSIMMAKCFPGVKVFAYEPVPRTFYQLIGNLELNKITPDMVFPVNRGVAGKAGRVEMIVSRDHSGGSTSWGTFVPSDHIKTDVVMVTLDEVLEPLKRVALMKIDIEGGEYDAVYNCHHLDKVDAIVGEFHSNHRLLATSPQYDPHELATYLGDLGKLIFYERLPMCE